MKLALLGGTPVRSRPFCPWPIHSEQEQTSLLEVLRSGDWGGYSPKVAEFESAFAALHKVRHAVSCVNGTVALETVLRALGVGCGDEVIVPPFTFIATATSVLLCHGVPVFADIDPETQNLDPAAVEAVITPRTRAIIVVHFGGRPADMDAFAALAQRHGLALIEDAAHAHGATWRGIPVGNFGVAGTFSFQLFKLMTAGEGGMMVTNSSEIAARLWSYCNQGRREGGGWYEHPTLGTNYRLTGFQAAVLLEQLRRLPEQTRRRGDNLRRFREGLARIPGLVMAGEDPRVGNDPHYIVTLRYDAAQFEGVERDLVIRALQAEGIPVQPTYPYPLYRNRVFHRCQLPPFGCKNWKPPQDYEHLYLPESESICREGIWLEHKLFLGENEDGNDILTGIEKVQRAAGFLRGFKAQAQAASP